MAISGPTAPLGVPALLKWGARNPHKMGRRALRHMVFGRLGVLATMAHATLENGAAQSGIDSNVTDWAKPRAQGLFDPKRESDACGVGFIVDLKNRPSHAIVEDALAILENLEHRGAEGAEAGAGDGAGILIQIPHAFFKEE